MNTHDFGKILLAVDGSPQSQNAVQLLTGFAAPGSQVVVLHVWDMEVRDVGGWWDVETYGEAQKLVEGYVTGLTGAGLHATGQVRITPTGNVAKDICKAADEFGADLVTMGSRGRSDLGGLFLGSISHQVVAGTDRPVLIVRAAPAQEKSQRRILLALANGEDIPSAVSTTIAVARQWQADVVVLHVAQVMLAKGVAWAEPAEIAEGAVKASVRELKEAGIPAQGEIVKGAGPIATEIAVAAEGWAADLIVMGSRRLGELRALLIGATDHALVHQIQTPVLITERQSR